MLCTGAGSGTRGKRLGFGPDDMGKPHEMMGTVENAFAAWAGHLRDHAAQIRAAAAS